MAFSDSSIALSDDARYKLNTRKRAIAKALQLNGHSDFAPVDQAYYEHFLFFFCSNILRFGKFAWQPQMQVT